MILKTTTWNIGGAKVRKGIEYNGSGIEYIVGWLKDNQPDIVALQEVQSNEFMNQAQDIAQKAGYPYVVYDEVSPSHLEEGYNLGNAIISKYPIIAHSVGVFHNPGKRVVHRNQEWVTHDKHFLRVTIDLEGAEMDVITTHLVPFEVFGIALNSSDAQKIFHQLSEQVKDSNLNVSRLLLLGDFNINQSTIKQYMSTLDDTIQEVPVDEPTIPQGMTLDHMFFKGVSFLGSEVDSATLVGHYALMARFSLESS